MIFFSLIAQRHAKPEDIRKEDSSLLVQIQILKQNIEKVSNPLNFFSNFKRKE